MGSHRVGHDRSDLAAAAAAASYSWFQVLVNLNILMQANSDPGSLFLSRRLHVLPGPRVSEVVCEGCWGGVSAPVVICPHTLLEVPGHCQVSPWLLKGWSGGVALQVLQCLEMVGFGPSGCSASVSFVDVSLILAALSLGGQRWRRGWLLPTASLTPLSLCAHWFF